MRCAKCGHDPELVATRSWKFRLHFEARSLNVLRNKSGRNDYYYSGFKKQIMRCLEETPGKPTLAKSKRRLTVTRNYTRRQKPYDFDNLVGGFKPLIDCLVSVGYLLGDRPVEVELYYDQSRTNQPTGFVSILLEDVMWPESSEVPDDEA